MKRGTIRSRRSLAALAAMASLPAFVSANPQNRNWIAGSSDWNTAGNWSPTGVPLNGDSADIINADSSSRTITYDYPGPAATLLALYLDNHGGGTDILSMANSGEALTAQSEYIAGYNGESDIGPYTGILN